MSVVTLIEQHRSPYERWVYQSSLYKARIWRPLDFQLTVESPVFMTLVLIATIAGALFIAFGLLFQSPVALLAGGLMLFSRLCVSAYIDFRVKAIRSKLARVNELLTVEGLQRVRLALVTAKRRHHYPSHLVELGVISQNTFDAIRRGQVERLEEILAKDYPLKEDGTKNL